MGENKFPPVRPPVANQQRHKSASQTATSAHKQREPSPGGVNATRRSAPLSAPSRRAARCPAPRVNPAVPRVLKNHAAHQEPTRCVPFVQTSRSMPASIRQHPRRCLPRRPPASVCAAPFSRQTTNRNRVFVHGLRHQHSAYNERQRATRGEAGTGIECVRATERVWQSPGNKGRSAG
jgi:hypothetical protein